MRILIENIKILALDEERVYESKNIGIVENRIDFVGAIPEGFKADKIINGKNKLAMPGLVNAHTHTPMSILRNYADDLALSDWLNNKIWPIEKKLSVEDVYWGSLLSIAEMISSGVTSFIDMYFHIDSIGEALKDSKMRGTVSRGLIGVEDKDRGQLKEADQFIDKWHNTENGRIKSMIAPHAIYTCPREYLVEALDLAESKDQSIHIHLSESNKEVEDSIRENGMTPVEYLEDIGIFNRPTVAAHCVQLNDADIGILSKNRVSVINNPTSNMKLGNGFARVEDMLSTDINLCLATDGSASNNNLNMFEEMHLAALVNKGVNRDPRSVSAIEALRIATVNGSVARRESDIGELKAGNKADITIVEMTGIHHYPKNEDISSLVYSTQASDVDTVIVDGNILLEEKRHTTIDIERTKYMVDKISRRLENNL